MKHSLRPFHQMTSDVCDVWFLLFSFHFAPEGVSLIVCVRVKQFHKPLNEDILHLFNNKHSAGGRKK